MGVFNLINKKVNQIVFLNGKGCETEKAKLIVWATIFQLTA